MDASPNGQTTVLAPLSFGARLRDLAAERDAARSLDVTLPDASARLGEPVTFRVRAMTLKEMRRLGVMPDPLAETIRAVQDEIVYYAMKAQGKTTKSEADVEREALLAYFKDVGGQDLEDFSDATRDATVLCCCVEPRVVLDVAGVIDLAHEVALEWISEADRAAIKTAVDDATGDLALRQLKSDLAARDGDGGDAAASAPAGDDLRDAPQPVAASDRPRRRAR